ncbi:hypothetical protein BH09ACT1_BH09ACT1_29720 [soil metagenome]
MSQTLTETETPKAQRPKSRIVFRRVSGEATAGTLTYSRSDEFFVFAPADPTRAGSSFQIGHLQVRVDHRTGQLAYIEGLHPAAEWRLRALPIPTFSPGSISAGEPTFGTTERIAGISLIDPLGWRTTFDEGTGWLRVAPCRPDADDHTILIADGIAVGLLGSAINSVWLHPMFE